MPAAGFVGRRRELAELRSAAASAAAGRGGLVLVGGEAGAGKTRLVQEAFADAAGAAGAAGAASGASAAVPAWGRSLEGSGAPPFWPWIDAARDLAATSGNGLAVARLIDLLTEGGSAASEVAAAAGARFLLLDDVSRALAALADEQRPLIVVVDDLHWADESSIALLEVVAARADRKPLLIVGTYRDDELGDDHPLAGAMATLARAGILLRLGGLGADDLAVLLGNDDPYLVASIHRQTGGNPFFARELARLADVEGRPAAAGVPGGVGAVVRRRLDRLPATCRTMLGALAILGEEAAVTVLAETAAPSDVWDAVDTAVRPGLLELSADRDRVRFVHALVRDVVLAQLATTERTVWHERTARALSAHNRGTATEVAAHMAAAVPLVPAAEAAMWARRAGEESLTRLAYDDAVAHFRRAVDLAPPADAELLLALGDAQLRAGQLESARETHAAVAGLGRHSGRPDLIARAALGFGAGLGGFEVTLFDQGQIDLLEEARTALTEADDIGLRALVASRLSVALSFVASEDRRLALAEEAIALAEPADDRRVLAAALAAHCDATVGPEHSEARLTAAGRVVELGQSSSDAATELLGLRLRLVAEAELGHFADVDRTIEAYARRAAQVRLPLYEWYVPLWRGMRALMRGRLDDAAEHTQAAAEIGGRAESGNAAMLAQVQRFMIARARGEVEEPLAWMEQFLIEVPGLVNSQANMAMLQVLAGRLDDARRSLAGLAAVRFTSMPRDSEWLPAMAVLAQAVAGVGDRDSAAVLLPMVEPFAERFAVEGIGAGVHGCLGTFVADLLDLVGRSADAARTRRAAAAAERAAGLRLDPLSSRDRRDSLDAAPQSAAAFVQQAGGWEITFAGATVVAPDSKGLGDLARLLARPGAEIHVSELTGVAGDGDASSAGEVLDGAAIAAYRRRLRAIAGELDEADARGDSAASSRLAEERDALVAQLAGAVGLGGRRRRAAEPNERMRKAVSLRLRRTIAQLAELHPALGRHLEHAVRTGTFCSYQPEIPVPWRLSRHSTQ